MSLTIWESNYLRVDGIIHPLELCYTSSSIHCLTLNCPKVLKTIRVVHHLKVPYLLSMVQQVKYTWMYLLHHWQLTMLKTVYHLLIFIHHSFFTLTYTSWPVTTRLNFTYFPTLPYTLGSYASTAGRITLGHGHHSPLTSQHSLNFHKFELKTLQGNNSGTKSVLG